MFDVDPLDEFMASLEADASVSGALASAGIFEKEREDSNTGEQSPDDADEQGLTVEELLAQVSTRSPVFIYFKHHIPGHPRVIRRLPYYYFESFAVGNRHGQLWALRVTIL